MPKQKYVVTADLNSSRPELSNGGLKSVVHSPYGSLTNYVLSARIGRPIQLYCLAHITYTPECTSSQISLMLTEYIFRLRHL